MTRRLFCGVVLALAVHAAIAAQSRDAVIDQTIATLLKVQSFGEVAISPDGRRVAYVNRGEGRRESGIFVAPADGSGEVLRISAAPVPAGTARPAPAAEGNAGKAAPRGAEESSIAWSPDGRELAFLSNAAGAQQLFVASSDGRDVRPLTSVKGALSAPKWSPDGKSIALLVIENASRRGGATEAMTPPSGDVEMQVEEQRIAIVDVPGRCSSRRLRTCSSTTSTGLRPASASSPKRHSARARTTTGSRSCSASSAATSTGERFTNPLFRSPARAGRLTERASPSSKA